MALLDKARVLVELRRVVAQRLALLRGNVDQHRLVSRLWLFGVASSREGQQLLDIVRHGVALSEKVEVVAVSADLGGAWRRSEVDERLLLLLRRGMGGLVWRVVAEPSDLVGSRPSHPRRR